MTMNQGASRIILQKSPYPSNFADHIKAIRQDPSFCSTCCNLFPGSAYSLAPRPDIYYHEHTGIENATAAAGKRSDESSGTENAEVVPTWAGISRLDYASWRFTARFADVVERAEEGCASCQVLQQGVEGLDFKAVQNGEVYLEMDIVFCLGDVLRVTIYRGEGEDDVDIFGDVSEHKDREFVANLEFYTLADKPSPWPTIGFSMKYEDPQYLAESWKGGQTRHLIVKPSISSSANLALHWLKSCDQEHESCKEHGADTPLPKRLVAVGPETNSGIHLFEHDDVKSPLKGKYVALSHCWGLSQHLTSIHANIEDWKKNIPWDLLPKTFQEAISLTRALGLSYVWIDSLCIIQDDAQDWDIEASKMGNIYNQAYLVIAATASVDGDGGLLFEKSPFVTIDGMDQNQKPFQVFFRYACSHSIFNWGVPSSRTQRATRYSLTYDAQAGYPLLTRAWCFQERLLGKRVLHFTKEEMVFECLTALNCECAALSDFKDEWLLPSRQMVSSDDRSLQPSSLSPTRSAILGRLPEYEVVLDKDSETYKSSSEWYDLASEYSEKNITRKSDWLPALGGVASKWISPHTGNYLAGLWSKDLLRGLLWQPSSPDKTENPEYIAPSWSWASLQRPVKWIYGDNKAKFMVEIDLNATGCKPKGVNEFGEVSNGWLSMTGRIVECTLAMLYADDSCGIIQLDAENRHSFFVDSVWRCKQYVGKKVLCLHYCTDRISKGQTGVHRALVISPVEDKAIPLIPYTARPGSLVCRRIGSITYFQPDKLEFENVSKQMRVCLL